MTLYLEAFDSYCRATCLSPLYLGIVDSKTYGLGTAHMGCVEGKLPGGYWVRIGDKRGSFKTKNAYHDGHKMRFWVARESLYEGDNEKPLRLQAQPLECPLNLYDWVAFARKNPDLTIEVTTPALFDLVRSYELPNPVKLNRTKPFPADVQEAWDIYGTKHQAWDGGHIIVEEIQTLTAIDVNTSQYAGGGSSILRCQRDIELYWHRVIPVILETIQARVLSGMILVDLPRLHPAIGLPILKSFHNTLEDLEIKSLGLTQGGLWELSRVRRISSLKRSLERLK